MRTKISEVSIGIRASDYEVIAFTETWLNSDIGSSELFNDKYVVYRTDRKYDVLACSRGGGVLVALKSGLSSYLICGGSNPNFEDVWVRVSFECAVIIIGIIYIPPNSQLSVFEDLVSTMENIRRNYKNAKLMVIGDFNLPNVEWVMEDGHLTPAALGSGTDEFLLTSMYYLELQQLNHIKNSLNRTLDLIFCDDFDVLSVVRSDNCICSLDVFHPPFEVRFCPAGWPLMDHKTDISLYLFGKAQYDDINCALSSCDWSFLTDCVDPDDRMEKFYSTLYGVIEQFVPKKTIKVDKFPRWYSWELKELIGIKNKLYKKYKRSGLESDYVEYSEMRRDTKHLIEVCYLLFISNTEQMIPTNIRYFWSYIKALRSENSLPRTMSLNGQDIEEPTKIAEAFANHFRSSYKNHGNQPIIDCSPSGNNNNSSLSFHNFTLVEIENKINALDVSKGAGPDGIPPIFVKNCKRALLQPLKAIFQISFDHGIFPAVWKESTLFPIFKSGSRNEIQNYRGISLSSTMSKIFEAIITDELFESCKHSIVDEQHGFYKHRSTATNLAIFQDFLVSNIEQGRQIDVIYTDLQKAFDSVCHDLLLKKLLSFGVHGVYLQWISSFLRGRFQRVKLGGATSGEIAVTSGVPQGSHLGPVLFLIFINDVVSVLRYCKCLLYADDLKFFCVIKSLDDCVNMQCDLECLVSWCKSNYLSLNVKKCKVMHFYRNRNPVFCNYFVGGTILESVETFNDLGVLFNSDVTFSSHIDNIIIKAFRMLGFIRRNCKYVSDTLALKVLYFALVRSILEYNSVIWSPSYNVHINRLERVQNKFARMLLWRHHFPYENIDYSVRLLLLGIDSLHERRERALLFFLAKILYGDINSSSLLAKINFRVPQRSTRSRLLFYENPHRTNYGFTTFVDRLIKNYNNKFHTIDIFIYNTVSSLKRSVCK